MGEAFDYAEAFKSLDLEAVIADLRALMTDSQPWWPADFGHYGGLFIRMACTARAPIASPTAAAARCRAAAFCAPQQLAGQCEPRQSAPADLADQAEIRPQALWADLIVLTGNVALESMGFKTFGFGGGRADVWEPEELYWGPEGSWLGDDATAANASSGSRSARCRWA